MEGASNRRVLITGAAGNLGGRLRRHLTTRGDYDLVLVDRTTAVHDSVVVADLSTRDPRWEQHFAGVDCVVHLAADGSQWAAWPSLLANNIVATINVLDAAVTYGIRRVVFASSLHAVLGYEHAGHRVTSDMPTLPENLYGVSKAVCEEIARNYAHRRGLSVLCLRLGWVYVSDGAPSPGLDSVALQQRWLSSGDFCRACERAIVVDDIPFAVLHVTSGVTGACWDLAEAARTIGYVPQDTLVPVAPTRWRRVFRRATRGLRQS